MRPGPQRAGLTLVEVVVALAIVTVAGALLLLRWVTRQEAQRVENAAAMAWVVDSARALAMRRGESLRLRVYADGLWSVVTPSVAEPVAAGTIAAPPAPIDLAIDPRGACRATAGTVPRDALRAAFIAGRCRFDP